MKHRFTSAEVTERAALRRKLKEHGVWAQPVYGGRRYNVIAGWYVVRGPTGGKQEVIANGHTFTHAARIAVAKLEGQADGATR